MSSNCWSNERILTFIEAVRSRPIIWDTSHKEYHNRMQKKQEWSSIAEEFEVSSKEVQRKYRSLRTYFRCEYNKRVRKSREENSILDSSWFGFNSMKFLLANYDHDLDNDQDDADDDHEQTQEISQHFIIQDDTSSIDIPKTPEPLKHKHSQHRRPTMQQIDKQPAETEDTRFYNRMTQAHNVLNSGLRSPEIKEDECDLFGKLLAIKLRRMPDRDRDELMYEIDTLYMRKKREILNEDEKKENN